MLDDDRFMPLIIERLPSVYAIHSLGHLRSRGWDWDDIESRLENLADDIAETDMPFADEAERYVQRLLIAAHAYEAGGNNN